MRISDWSSDVCSSDLITRTCAWNGPGNEVLDDWNAILDHLRLDDAIKRHAAGVLKAFGEQQLPRLADRLRALEADADIVEACAPGIEHQMRAVREIGHADQATPQPSPPTRPSAARPGQPRPLRPLPGPRAGRQKPARRPRDRKSAGEGNREP